jgi:hypothetical protein
MLERFKQMSPAERNDFLARMKDRGVDVTPFQDAKASSTPSAPARGLPSAGTIDALFGPLPAVESRGRVWTYANNLIKPVSLRLGITDGTNTELISGDVTEGTELVTGVVLGSVRASTPAGANPLIPGGRGFGPGGGGGRGR